MSHSIADLRKHLFDTIAALKDSEKPMDLERAKTIADVAQTIINSAKVEVDFMRLRGDKGSGFVPEEKQLPGTPERPRLIRGKAMSGSD
jgi:hypothetical protein